MIKELKYKEYKNYMIDEYGNVYSKDRMIVKRDGVKQFRYGKKLSHHYSTDGYPLVKLSANGISKNIAVHILVATAFIPNPDKLPEVNHIDCDRRNCYYKNLEWVTHSQNVAHSHKLGHYNKPQFKKSGNPRARGVKNVTDNIVFTSLGECAEWLIENKYTQSSIDNARSEIIKSCKTSKKYLSKKFEYV